MKTGFIDAMTFLIGIGADGPYNLPIAVGTMFKHAVHDSDVISVRDARSGASGRGK